MPYFEAKSYILFLELWHLVEEVTALKASHVLGSNSCSACYYQRPNLLLLLTWVAWCCFWLPNTRKLLRLLSVLSLFLWWTTSPGSNGRPNFLSATCLWTGIPELAKYLYPLLLINLAILYTPYIRIRHIARSSLVWILHLLIIVYQPFFWWVLSASWYESDAYDYGIFYRVILANRVVLCREF